MHTKNILFVFLILFSTIGYSQSKKIHVIHADNTYVDSKYPGATISQGDVFVELDGATLRCDRAYIYQELKLMKALGNVVINQGDTIHQYSKYADYDGDKMLATSWGNVVLNDQFMTLKTDTLYFDREKQHLYYNSGGTIKDTTNFLQSEIGNYYLSEKKFHSPHGKHLGSRKH